MRESKKIIIIISLILLEVTSIFLMYKSLSDKETAVDNVALNKENTLSKDMFAVLLEQDDGSFKESSETNFSNLGNNYIYNTTLSGCMDMDGVKIDNALSYNSNTKKVKKGANDR